MLALANTAVYATRNSLFAVYPDLRSRFGLHDDRLGLLATAFLIPHGLATLLFGWAGDRFDRRRVIAVGLAIATVAGAAGALASDLVTLVVSRALVGLGTAAVVPVANSILGQVYDGPVKASRMSIFNLGLLFGGVVGFYTGDWVGFPGVVVVLAVPCAALGLVLLALPVPSKPGFVEARAESSLARMSMTFATSARKLLGIRTLRWLLFSTTAMAFAAGGYNAWLLDFLVRDKHMTTPAATQLLVTSMIGAVAGILFGGRLADRLRKRFVAGRLVTIAIGMACALPCACLCIELPPGSLLYTAGIATMFFMFWYHAPIAVSVDDLSPPTLAVAAQGVVIFTMHLVGTAPSSWIVGLVSDRWSLYTAMWVPTGALLVATVCISVAATSFAADHRRARGAITTA